MASPNLPTAFTRWTRWPTTSSSCWIGWKSSNPSFWAGCRWGDTWRSRWCSGYPERVRGLILCDTRAAADTPEAAKGREDTAQDVLRAGKWPVDDRNDGSPAFRQDDAGEASAAGRGDAGGHGTDVARRESPVPCAAWRSARIGGATWQRITVPTLVLVGEDDVISPPAEARELAAAHTRRAAGGYPRGRTPCSLREPGRRQRCDHSGS